MSGIRYDLDRQELASSYLETSKAHQLQNARALLEKAGLSKGDVVLDLGCGTGNVTMLAADIVGPTGRVIAFDPAGARIKLAQSFLERANEERRQHNLPALNIEYHEGTSDDVPGKIAPDTKFDVAYANSVVHWISPQARQRTFATIDQLLKSGGRIAVAGGSGDYPHFQDVKISVLSREPYASYPREGEAKMVKQAEMEAIFFALGHSAKYETVKRDMKFNNTQAFLEWADASSSGNFKYVDFLPESLRNDAWREIASEYEKRASPETGEFIDVSSLLYAISTKA